jgi:hypothetical protein
MTQTNPVTEMVLKFIDAALEPDKIEAAPPLDDLNIACLKGVINDLCENGFATEQTNMIIQSRQMIDMVLNKSLSVEKEILARKTLRQFMLIFSTIEPREGKTTH